MPPFFQFFGHPKNHQKINPSKNYFFEQCLKHLATFRLIFNDDWSKLGPPGKFFDFLAARIFSRCFHQIVKKNIKTKKSEKCVLAYRIQCFVRVAMLEKTRERPGKSIKFSIELLSKIDPKSS